MIERLKKRIRNKTRKKNKKRYQYENRVEQFIVRRSDSGFGGLNHMGHISNNTFNLATYHSRQWFFRDIYVSITKLHNLFKYMNDTKENCLRSKLSAQICQQTLRMVNKNFKAFFRAEKKWEKHPKEFTGRPKPPNYRTRGGVCTFVIDNQDFTFDKKNNQIEFINPKSNHKHVKPWKKQLHPIQLNPHIDIDHIGQITVVPKRYYEQVLVSYQVKIPKVKPDNHRYIFIDLGVNNLCCIGSNIKGLRALIINGRPVKSINQYANKQIADTRRTLMKCNGRYTSHHLDFLFTKRHFKLENYMHEASKCVVDYALNRDCSRIIIGNGVTTSKRDSKMGKKNNQNFISIPFRTLMDKIKYKAHQHGIGVIITEESYTSQSSFLDNEKPCAKNGNEARAKRDKLYRKRYGTHLYKRVIRRVARGDYVSDTGKHINADLDGALQIGRKVVPRAFDAKDLEGYVTSPRKLTLPN